MSEIVIPVEWLLGTLIMILSAMFGLLFKNTWDTIKIKTCIKNIEGLIKDHSEQAEKNREKLEKHSKDIAIIKERIYLDDI